MPSKGQRTVLGKTRRFQPGYLRHNLAGLRTVERHDSSLPFCEESGPVLASLGVVLRQLYRLLLRSITFEVGSGGGLEMLAEPFVAGEIGFFSARTRVGCVPAWLLMIRMLGTPDLGRILLRGFLQASLPCSMAPLAGTATWLGAGGAVGVFDRVVTRALYFGGIALLCPQNGPLGAKETR